MLRAANRACCHERAVCPRASLHARWCACSMLSHTHVCCAQKAALVETQITQIAVTPHADGSSTTGKTDLVYTLRLSPKKIADTEVRACDNCPLDP